MVAAVLVAVFVVFWVTREGSGESAAGDRIEHIHGLGVNPADGKLYAAAHNGVFRVGSKGKAQRVGDGGQDTMGFTIVGEDHFLGSGHSAAGTGGPANLGLIESTDGGKTWKTVSLEDQADFHALRFRHGNVYGYNAGQLMVSGDKRTWDTRGQVGLRDFAVSPSDPDTLVASGEQGLMRSSDGGRNWSERGAAVLLLDWPADDQLWAVGVDGKVMRSADGGEKWSDVGAVEGQAAAFAVHGDTLYFATAEGEILQSRDEGKTWDTRYS
ncbi:MAG: hypothetical protein GEU94_02610 [Micromonosporaceae bacterium]|nr:hypothetical protein [Micromonosporaceae bacterium]